MSSRRTREEVSEDRRRLMQTMLKLGEVTYETLSGYGHVRYVRNDMEQLIKKGFAEHGSEYLSTGYYRKRMHMFKLTDKGIKEAKYASNV